MPFGFDNKLYVPCPHVKNRIRHTQNCWFVDNLFYTQQKRITLATLLIVSFLSEKIIQNGLFRMFKKPTATKEQIVQEKRTIQCCDRQYPTSFCNQLLVLLKRNFLILTRDPTLTYSRLITHTTIALFLGILYYGIGKDASNVLNNFNFMFFTVMFLMFTAFNCVTTTCKYSIFCLLFFPIHI